MPRFAGFFQRFLNLFDPPIGQIAADHGRIVETDSLFNDPNPDAQFQEDGAQRYTDMLKNPFIWAALDYRDVSRIWVSAAEIRDKNPLTGLEYCKHPGQLLAPPKISKDVQKFLEWQLDERLERPLELIFQEAQRSYLAYGFACLECIWQNENTPFGLRSVITDIQIIDVDRIIIRRLWSDGTPVSDEQEEIYRMDDVSSLQIYLKKYHTNNEDLIPFPPAKVALITNKGDFGNPYGQAELKPLVSSEFSYRNVSTFWDRHLERHGSPQMVHKYSADREGSQWDNWRKNQLATIAKMQNQSVIQLSEKGSLEALSASGETQSFLERLELLRQDISVAMCGSATALVEGKTGARAKEEATTVRQKSAREQYDCSLLEACFNYQIIPWLTDLNFGKQEQYCYIQMIPPEDITPTTPEGQEQEKTSPEMALEGDENKNEGNEQGSETEESNDEMINQEDEMPMDEEPKEFAEGGNLKKKEETLPEDSKVGGFPERRTPNPLYKDPEVQRQAANTIGGLTVYTKREFDRLEPEEKKAGFTFAGMPEDKEKIGELLQIYIDSLSIPNERKAFLWVRNQIREKDWGQTYTDSELMPSFRYARLLGYNSGVIEKAKNSADTYALMYVTKDDPSVRWNHSKMHGVIQPIDSEFWRLWQPPTGFGCRCSIKIITQAMHMQNPQKYSITDWNKDINPDRGW